MLPAPTPRLQFREMTAGDLAEIATLEIGGSRGPEGWIEWTLRNYEQYGFGLWVIETHAGDFTTGCIENRLVPCYTAEGQRYFHSGYELRDVDLRDLATLDALSAHAD